MLERPIEPRGELADAIGMRDMTKRTTALNKYACTLWETQHLGWVRQHPGQSQPTVAAFSQIRARLKGIFVEAPIRGSSMAGPKFDPPGFGQKRGALDHGRSGLGFGRDLPFFRRLRSPQNRSSRSRPDPRSCRDQHCRREIVSSFEFGVNCLPCAMSGCMTCRSLGN